MPLGKRISKGADVNNGNFDPSGDLSGFNFKPEDAEYRWIHLLNDETANLFSRQ